MMPNIGLITHVPIHASDAGTINIKTGTGDVSGSLLSGKVFSVTSDTGNVKVPDTQSGGLCEIHTNTGDINITVMK